MEAGPEQMIFIRLLAAHLLADFFLQPYGWIRNRKAGGIRSRHLWYHIGLVGLLTWLFLGIWDEWRLPLFITFFHLLIDWWKSTRSDSIWHFIADQAAHILVLIAGWFWYSYGFQSIGPDLYDFFVNRDIWILGTSMLLITRPIGFLIEKLTGAWQAELTSPSTNGLSNAGSWIGYLERLLILVFMVMGQFAAIGFLIAAKSIFRFTGWENNPERRKQAEYILIGTLFSFALGIAVGIGTLHLLQL